MIDIEQLNIDITTELNRVQGSLEALGVDTPIEDKINQLGTLIEGAQAVRKILIILRDR